MEILNPRQLWEDYDTNILLDETLIKESENGRIRYLYFNGAAECGEGASADCRIRIYAKLILPKKDCLSAESDGQTDVQKAEKPPVIIYVGGMTEDIDKTDVSFLLQGGYAVLLVDYAGDTGNKARYSVYPKGIDAYWQSAPEKIKTPNKLKNCCWYYWTACVLSAAAYLESCGLVDKDKICIFGAHEGASLVWKSSEKSPIKCGVTFYGGEGVAVGGADSGADGEMLRYKAALESLAYAKTAYPILINAGTNSRECSFDYLSALYDESPLAAFCVYPNSDAAVSDRQRNNILPWFDSILSQNPIKAPKKELTVFGSEGMIYAEVELQQDAERIEIYYAEDCLPACRHFKRLLPPKVGENKYLVKLDVFDVSRSIFVFALIINQGCCFTTSVIVKQPAKLGMTDVAGLQSHLVFQSDEDKFSTGFLRPEGDFLESKKLRLATGPLDLMGICGDELVTFKLGDSKFKGSTSSLLQLTLSAAETQEIELFLIDKTGGEYFCPKKIVAGQWVTLSLSASEFKSQKGTTDFSLVAGVKIKGKALMLNSILWV